MRHSSSFPEAFCFHLLLPLDLQHHHAICLPLCRLQIRVLSVSLEDAILWRRTLRPCQLQRLLSEPTSSKGLAGDALRQRFHQLFLGRGENGRSKIMVPEEGVLCPIFLDDMGKEGKLVACGTCQNVVHEECFVWWRRSKVSGATRCVICKARWRNRVEQDEHLSDDDVVDRDYCPAWVANSLSLDD